MITLDFVYLASASPRRRALLEQIGIRYRLLDASVPEVPAHGEAPKDYVTRLAKDKALAGRALISCGEATNRSDAPVLAADTAVVVDDAIFGKPRDRDDGIRMLLALSGRTHEVLTGVALLHGERLHVRLSRSRVSFRSVSRAEALRYWESGEPADKAGAYAIQGRGALFVADLCGSQSGVMGLPLFETGELLALAAGRGS